jgi:hypothetical protein
LGAPDETIFGLLFEKNISYGFRRRHLISRSTLRLSGIRDARVLVIQPFPVQGLGRAGGFKMMLEDREVWS